MRCWVEKVSATLHDVEEATARAFDFMIDEKVSLLCFLRASFECNVFNSLGLIKLFYLCVILISYAIFFADDEILKSSLIYPVLASYW